jgi:hypothetical protein
MEQENDRLDPVVQAMVEEQLTPNECIQGWTRTPTDDVVVYITNKDLKAAYELAARNLHRAVRSSHSFTPWWEVSTFLGHGRSLVFADQEEEWVQVGLGSWGQGLSDLLRYFEVMAQDDPNPHWQHGIELCRLWFMLDTSKVTQEVIDRFLARLDAEPNPGPVWLDFRTQFANWARRGLNSSNWPPKG